MQQENQEVVNIEKTPVPVASKSSSKGMLAGMIICAVLGVAGISLGAYGIIQNSYPSQAIIPSEKEEANEVVAAVNNIKELQAQEIVEEKEIAITNPYLKKDLDHKIAILHDVNNSSMESNSFIRRYQAYNSINSVYDNTLTTTQKAIITIEGALSPISSYGAPYFDLEKIVSDYIKTNFPDRYNLVNVSELGYIPYDYLNDLMHSTFGYDENVPKDDLINTCGELYFYIESLDGFIDGKFSTGCGGAGFPILVANKTAYTAKGDEAYVYVKSGTAFSNNDTNGTYALYDQHYAKREMAETGLVQDGLNDYNDLVETNSSLLDSLKQYRFVFKKNKDGVYSFVRVEEA